MKKSPIYTFHNGNFKVIKGYSLVYDDGIGVCEIIRDDNGVEQPKWFELLGPLIDKK